MNSYRIVITEVTKKIFFIDAADAQEAENFAVEGDRVDPTLAENIERTTKIKTVFIEENEDDEEEGGGGPDDGETIPTTMEETSETNITPFRIKKAA